MIYICTYQHKCIYQCTHRSNCYFSRYISFISHVCLSAWAVYIHRRTRGGGRRAFAPPFWDILLRISRKEYIFLNISQINVQKGQNVTHSVYLCRYFYAYIYFYFILVASQVCCGASERMHELGRGGHRREGTNCTYCRHFVHTVNTIYTNVAIRYVVILLKNCLEFLNYKW